MVILRIVLTKYFTLCSEIESAFFSKSDVRPVGFFRNRVGFRQQPAAISTPGSACFPILDKELLNSEFVQLLGLYPQQETENILPE